MLERIGGATTVVVKLNPAVEILSGTYIETVVDTVKDVNVVHRGTIRLAS